MQSTCPYPARNVVAHTQKPYVREQRFAKESFVVIVFSCSLVCNQIELFIGITKDCVDVFACSRITHGTASM